MLILIIHLHYKIILRVLRVYVARAGRGWTAERKRKMNIILYYIILYIIIYIYIVVNILPFCANSTPILADRFFFFDSAC